MSNTMRAKQKIRVLVVDDSEMVRNILHEIISADPDLEIAGMADNGLEAVELCSQLLPEVITMDVQMPKMDGFQATEKIMAYTPTPILIFSSALDKSQQYTSFQAIALGALDIMAKPDLSRDGFQEIAGILCKKIKLLARIQVIQHIHGKLKKSGPVIAEKSHPIAIAPPERRVFSLVVIGASTGGPVALEKLLGKLPGDFPLPLAAVQHITEGFIGSYADWLNSRIELRVKLGEHGEKLSPGTVYFAPDGVQMSVSSAGLISLDSHIPPLGEHKPAINHLFFTTAEAFGQQSIAILLTGMGKDGAEGMKSIRRKRGLTIAQDRQSALIYGMPRAAVEIGAAEMVLPLEKIASHLITCCKRS